MPVSNALELFFPYGLYLLLLVFKKSCLRFAQNKAEKGFQKSDVVTKINVNAALRMPSPTSFDVVCLICDTRLIFTAAIAFFNLNPPNLLHFHGAPLTAIVPESCRASSMALLTCQ
uniref:Uncharacterized protein n=1 Tax=Eutreptiella gymnastica TaxID=73025 RepID=A0A7S1N2K5_9EUGL